MHPYRPIISPLGVALCVLLACSLRCVSANGDTRYAVCTMRPSSTLAAGLPEVSGQVLFKQDYLEGRLQVLLRLSGFPEQSEPSPRAVHIHQYGDLSRGCDSTGGHYNPQGVDHPHHPGDFGNFESNQGTIDTVFESEATLVGGQSVLGRAVVVHEKIDDLGQGGDTASLLNGNAGRRLGCCIIIMSSPDFWNRSRPRREKGK